MSRWRELAAAAGHDDRPPPERQPDYGLPPELVADLRSLASLPPPRKLENPSQWRVVVRDALGLARTGWASSALALGWTPIDLFGVGIVESWDFAGLAVWLDGRTIVALDARIAVAEGPDGRETFYRGGHGHGSDAKDPIVLLWQFGRS
jgi:hypothetical protein